MTRRLIGTTNYTMNYKDMNQRLSDEMSRARCCGFPGRGSAVAKELLESLELVESLTNKTESSVKTATERITNVADILYDPLSRLTRAHSLRLANDPRGCWRLLELVDPIVFGNLEPHAQSIESSIKEVENLERAVQEIRTRVAPRHYGMNGSSLQKCIEKTREYAVNNFDMKAAMTTLLTQRLLAVKNDVIAISKTLSEIRTMTKPDMAEKVSDLRLVDTIEGLRTRTKKIASRKVT